MYDLTLGSRRIFEMFLLNRKIRIAGVNNTRTDHRFIYGLTTLKKKKKKSHGFDFRDQRLTNVLQAKPSRGVELFFLSLGVTELKITEKGRACAVCEAAAEAPLPHKRL